MTSQNLEFEQSTRREIGGSFFCSSEARRCVPFAALQLHSVSRRYPVSTCFTGIFAAKALQIRRTVCVPACFDRKKAEFLEIPPAKCYAILYIAALRRGKRERRAVCRGEAAVTGKENRLMKTKKRKRGLSVLLAVLAAAACLLTGCGAQKSEAQEDAETI